MIWITALVFFVMILVLVMAHELGHFIVAKKAGCRIEEFAFGFPPTIFSRVFRGTKYAFNLLPLGGYVKIEGEDMDENEPGPGSFASKPAGWRAFILSAGVLMNLVLAVVLLTVQSGIGAPVIATQENASSLLNKKTYIVEIAPGSPADALGLMAYDRFVEIQGVKNPSIDNIQGIVDEYKGTTIVLEVERQGRHIAVNVVPRANPPDGEGALGVTLVATGLQKTSLFKTPIAGIRKTGEMTVAIVSQFTALGKRLIVEGNVGDALTGPVGIAMYTHEATQLGASYLLDFAALISINLALINILPIPALDGGRVLFVLFEIILGRRIPGRVETISHTIGFVALILLMLVITFRDVQRLLY